MDYKLFEVANDLVALAEKLENLDPKREDDVELREVIEDTMEGLEGDFAVKCDKCVRLLDKWEAEETAIKNYITKLQNKANSLRAAQTNLRQYILRNMRQAGIERVEVSYSRAINYSDGRGSVVITDVAALPDEFVAVERKPRRSEIGKALAKGESVPGARLEYNPFITIR